MNSLTSLIYFGDITGSLTGFFLMIGMLLCFFGVVAATISIIDKLSKTILFAGVTAAVVGVIFMFTASILPSKEGVYMIASAQMNEDIIKNPKTDITNKTYNVINKYLDNQLAEKNR